jgi:hypothetical protein
MSRIKLLGVSLVAVFALFALTAASAMAVEEKTKMLPETGVTFTGKQTAEVGKLVQSGSEKVVECKKGKGTGTIESANLGKYTTTFEECSSSGAPCTGLGDAAKTIKNEGTYHFWLALETLNGTANTLVGALVFLPIEKHFTCELLGIKVLILVKGCVAALATSLNTLVATTKDIFRQRAIGVELITEVLPEGTTKEIECKLLSEENSTGFKQSSIVGEAENEKFKKGETVPTILLMNPGGVN